MGKIAEGRRQTDVDSLVAVLRRDRPELIGELSRHMILLAHSILDVGQSSEKLVLNRLHKKSTSEVQDVMRAMGPAALRFFALVALELGERLGRDDGARILRARSDHGGGDGKQAGTSSHRTTDQGRQPGPAARDPELQAILTEVCFCIDNEEFLDDKQLMGLARFYMQRAGDEACRKVFLDEHVLAEGRAGSEWMKMAEDAARRYKEARVRGMFVWDRYHYSIIVRGQDGKTTYLDTLEEKRSIREASAQAFYERYLRDSDILPDDGEGVNWVAGSIPAQPGGWECGLLVVKLWLRFVEDSEFDPASIEQWDLATLASKARSDIRDELGEQITEAGPLPPLTG